MTQSRSVILVVMGVSGSGKTTLGMRLAGHLSWPFKEGDDLHPPASVAKLRAGVPLTDADRAPWLEAVGCWIDECRGNRASGIVTCSTLKLAYRQALAKGRPEVRFVYLKGDPALLTQRLRDRRDHFMPPSLLASQFEDLEPPTPEEAVIEIEADQSVEAQVDQVDRLLSGAPLRT